MPLINADARKEYNRQQYLKKKVELAPVNMVCLLKFHSKIQKVNAEFVIKPIKPQQPHLNKS